MSAPSQIWEMPDYKPTLNMRVMAHAYVQWVKQDRPIVGPEFIEDIINADMEVMSHLHYIDDQIEFEKKNPSETQTSSILKDLGYE